MANWFKRNKDPLTPDEWMQIIEKSSKQVGPGVFYSTIIVVTSFRLCFCLRVWKATTTLAWTKNIYSTDRCFLAITLTPVLISLFLKGRLKPESANPITKTLEKIYTPILKSCLRWRKTTIGIIIALIIGIVMMTRLDLEFMPPLDEGLSYLCPLLCPTFPIQEAKRLLQVQDKIISTVPEVSHVLGKAGRANTATDNSPVSMIETIIL